MSEPTQAEKPLTFETALAELEALVTRMEDGQLSLEESLQSYQRGTELLKFCQGLLQDAQQKVLILEADTLKPFAGAENQQ